MQIKVKVENIRELIHASGISMMDVARRMGLSETMVSLKINGQRTLFADEIGSIVGAINDGGRATVSEDQVIKLIGKKNLGVRGFAE